VVARVAVQLLARNDRRAGCMTRGRGLPCWARWKSERCAHLARLHAACMAARPFTRWSFVHCGCQGLNVYVFLARSRVFSSFSSTKTCLLVV
jgi:hypothetical protein